MLSVTTKYTRDGDERPIRTSLDAVTGVEVTVQADDTTLVTMYIDNDGRFVVNTRSREYLRNGCWKPTTGGA